MAELADVQRPWMIVEQPPYRVLLEVSGGRWKAQKRRCISTGMHFRETHPAGSPSAASRNQTKRAAAHPNPLCSTKEFWLRGGPVSEA
jgi:hypothetical protein